MALDTLTTAPAVADFTLLDEHQAQTPGTFFGGKPVLHLHAPATTLKAPSDQTSALPELTQLAGGALTTSDADGALDIPGVDVWVTSRNLLLYSPTHATGFAIPYQTITVTAQDARAVLLELNLSEPDTADEDIRFVQLRMVPGETQHHQPSAPTEAAGEGATNGTTNHDDAATALYRAISACQELNPDPVMMGDEDDEDGEDDETAPGASGWITSENMGDFVDAEGNFRMPEGMAVLGGEVDEEEGEAEASLGAGAGRTRTAAEVDGDEVADGEESKWQRTA